jgi:hypothetical protein
MQRDAKQVFYVMKDIFTEKNSNFRKLLEKYFRRSSNSDKNNQKINSLPVN